MAKNPIRRDKVLDPWAEKYQFHGCDREDTGRADAISRKTNGEEEAGEIRNSTHGG
jgi:hypothetical protein